MSQLRFSPAEVPFASRAGMAGAAADVARVAYPLLHVPLEPRVSLTAPTYIPATPAPFESSAATSGPNPYVDYERRYTAEDGIAFTYKTIDESEWRMVVRILALLFLLMIAFAYQVDASPYPILPPGCRPLGSCPVTVPGGPLATNLLMLAAFGLACYWIMFTEVQVYRDIEIRPDCMILDGTDVFWAEKFDLGWPSFTAGEGDMRVLTGIYGTRYTEFLRLKAFDENDRAPRVFAAQLAAAMEQQWAQH